MNRRNLELMIAWLDALRRRDVEAAGQILSADVTWDGVREDLECRGRDVVVESFLEVASESEIEIDAVELVAGPGKVAMGGRRPDLREIEGTELFGQIFNVFEIRDGQIVGIRDYRTRAEALDAAGVNEQETWR